MNTKESETTENKLSLSERKEITESVAAFATASGGVIRIGVNNDGQRVGVQVGNRTLEDLANYITKSVFSAHLGKARHNYQNTCH